MTLTSNSRCLISYLLLSIVVIVLFLFCVDISLQSNKKNSNGNNNNHRIDKPYGENEFIIEYADQFHLDEYDDELEFDGSSPDEQQYYYSLVDELIEYESQIVQNPMLHAFIVRNYAIPDEYTAKYLATVIGKHKNIVSVTLGNNRGLDSDRLDIILNYGVRLNEQLEQLVIEDAELDLEDCRTIHSLLVSPLNNVQRLGFTRVRMPKGCIIEIFHDVRGRSKLKQMKITDTFVPLSGSDLRALLYFAARHGVTALSLRNSKITAHGAKILSEFLSTESCKIEVFDISSNTNFGLAGWRRIVSAIQHANTLYSRPIHRLYISDTRLVSAKRLILLKQLIESKSVRDSLDIGDNAFGNNGAMLIADVIKNNKVHLLNMDMSGTKIRNTGMRQLLKSVPDDSLTRFQLYGIRVYGDDLVNELIRRRDLFKSDYYRRGEANFQINERNTTPHHFVHLVRLNPFLHKSNDHDEL
jgi:hypothetical protein